MAESRRSNMCPECPLTTHSSHSSDRRNGYECSLPDDCNTRLADSCTAQRYFRYMPIAAGRQPGKLLFHRQGDFR